MIRWAAGEQLAPSVVFPDRSTPIARSAMNCQACGTENPGGVAFCINCGTPFAEACAVCGAARVGNARFCGNCGTRFPDAAPLEQPDATEPASGDQTERRLVSVLFADLVGFTPYTEARDSEDVRETLDRYFDIARAAVAGHGGIIEKFIGDAVMAVWGAPVAREDDAERAVRAALELVDQVKALNINARAGVLTGEAVVRLGAEGEGMVVGDTVNTAARLQSAAEPGTVIVGEGTYRAASRAIVFEPVGELTLKGKGAPVAAWRAVRVVAERGGRNRAEALEAPFVGRDDELRLLKELFSATERDSRVRLVSVVGPAGIGKTRLAREFGRYLDGLIETVYWHVGRSPAYGQGITFWALGEMVRARAGLLESDDEATTRAKLAETLAQFVPDETERRWIESALLALLGIETRVGSSELFAAWRTFFERLARVAPVVMVFEDHHHADTGLLDFIDHLLEWSRDVPLCVIILARPELLERRPDWAVGKRDLNLVHLEPLPAAAMLELIRGLVPGLPDEAVETIVERAEGVPLYAVETIRMLLAEGRLVPEDRRPERPRHPRVPDGAHHEPPRWPGSSRSVDRLGRSGPRPELHADRAGGGLEAHGGRAPGAPANSRPPRAPDDGGRSALARAWPVCVRPGAHPRGRVRDAVAQGSEDPASRRGAVLREPRLGGAGRSPGRPLPRRAPERRRGR
jgi:class 3 adenylate cyclase